MQEQFLVVLPQTTPVPMLLFHMGIENGCSRWGEAHNAVHFSSFNQAAKAAKKTPGAQIFVHIKRMEA